MNKMIFIPFLLFMLSLIAYLFFRGIQVLSPQPDFVKIIYVVVFVLMMASFFYRMFKGDTGNLNTSYITGVIGFTWFFAIVYFALIALSVDIARVAIKLFHIYPQYIKDNLPLIKNIIALSSFSIFIVLVIIGNYNFNHPAVTELTLKSDTSDRGKSIKIVMASDIHMSSYIGTNDITRMVNMINSQNPDIVLFAGDLADRNYEPLYKLNLGDELSKIKTKYGVYAIPGNHEFYGGHKNDIIRYLSSKGVNFLVDSVVEINNELYIIGRDDKTNRHRATLDALLLQAPKQMPKILLDHQPYNLHESQNKVDLQLSGHTHKGQFWPATSIVKSMYELAYGYLKKGTTHYYVSSGLGIWGPKIRLGSKSELVVINFFY